MNGLILSFSFKASHIKIDRDSYMRIGTFIKCVALLVLRKLTVCRHWTLDRLPVPGFGKRRCQSRNGVSEHKTCVRLVSLQPERTPAQNIGPSIRI